MSDFTVAPPDSEWICPKCKRFGRDMRGSVFNEGAVFSEGVCFQWADDKYTCCHPDMKTPVWMP